MGVWLGWVHGGCGCGSMGAGVGVWGCGRMGLWLSKNFQVTAKYIEWIPLIGYQSYMDSMVSKDDVSVSFRRPCPGLEFTKPLVAYRVSMFFVLCQCHWHHVAWSPVPIWNDLTAMPCICDGTIRHEHIDIIIIQWELAF